MLIHDIIRLPFQRKENNNSHQLTKPSYSQDNVTQNMNTSTTQFTNDFFDKHIVQK